ncbi:MAG TPA: HAMP domain-containing sensor histidine kinase [Spirillospora sp.]|nr:HAMP domain-containing sensor histidine kinase [Spirillospora sp.]
MTQLHIDAGLYEKIRARASESDQSVEEWLAAVSQESDLPQFHNWFVRLVGHDLRTPLAAILTSADILKHYQHRMTDERRLEHLGTIQMQVRAINNLLDNVMVIQKYTTGALHYDAGRHNLADTCRSAAESAASMAYEQREVVVQAPDDIIGLFDENLLVLALTNVLTNAIRFSADDTPVYLTLAADAGRPVIQVRDQGIGIPVDEQPKVYDLFFSASNAQSRAGKGLGLAVVRWIIDLHNGTLALDSAPGRGTTVTITLPAA